jgi:hypothetical protein
MSSCASEIKFVSELGADHRLQALVYAALHAAQHERTSSCVLFNARTGERERVHISAEHAVDFLVALARFKHSGDMMAPATGTAAVPEVISDTSSTSPRVLRRAPAVNSYSREVGTNPRARGTNPRARGTNPQRRAIGDVSTRAIPDVSDDDL